MKFLPYDRFEIETAMNPEDIVETLKTKVDYKKLFHFSSNHVPFQGDISQEGFEISRIIHYRNSFLPVISGRLQPNASGTKIVINMSLHSVTVATICAASVWTVLIFLLLLVDEFSEQSKISFITFLPLFMMIFLWAIVSCGFWFEAKKQKTMLLEMFDDLDTDK